MEKNIKYLMIGGAIAVVGYYLWKDKTPSAAVADMKSDLQAAATKVTDTVAPTAPATAATTPAVVPVTPAFTGDVGKVEKLGMAGGGKDTFFSTKDSVWAGK